MSERLGILGRERMLVNMVTRQLLDAAGRKHEYTEPKPTDRGATFRLRLFEGNEDTRRIVSVTIELESVEQE